MSIHFAKQLEILKAARGRIADKSNWTTNHAARDKNSRPVSALSDKAYRWCAMGAITRVADEMGETSWWDAAKELTPSRHGSVMWVNDNLGHKAVLEMFDKAISRMEGIGEREKIRYTE